MAPKILARHDEAKKAQEIIRKSFIERKFDSDFIKKINSLVIDAVHVDQAVLAEFGWSSIYTEDNDGYLDSEIDLLIEWFKKKSINSIFVTSPERVKNCEKDQVLVMELCAPTSEILLEVQGGGWMFSELSELASQRVSDWRSDIYFSEPLSFLILAEHGAYGTTTICGPEELIMSIKSKATHGEFEWHLGVVPETNKGAAFPKT